MYKIMVVDDEQLTRTFLKNIIPKLHEKWIVVDEASDGEEACKQLAVQDVDLVVTDIKMPIMDGVALCKYIFHHHPHIQTVILSGYGEFDYAKQAISFNVTNYLLKPIVNEDLQKVLSDIAQDLDKRHDERIIHRNLLELSSKYKEELITKLLMAIVSQSHVQIKVLLPLIYELEINFIEEEGVIVILQLTDIALSQESFLKNSDLTNLLIYQTAMDILAHTTNKVFLDSHNNTLIYLPINNQADIQQTVYEIFEPINALFNKATSLDLVCYVGSKESEILQLYNSYLSATKNILHSMLISTQPHGTVIIANEDYSTDILDVLQQTLSTYAYALQKQDIITINYAKNNLLAFTNQHISPSSMNQFGLYIINQLSHLLLLTDSFVVQTLNINKLFDSLEKNLLKTADDLNENMIISTAKKYIYNHFNEPISLSMIAEHLSISPSYLSNLFHESVGQSYIKYLTEVRLKQAALLLQNDQNLTLEKIAKQVGYISVKHFSYVFKKSYHITPGEYRKNSKK